MLEHWSSSNQSDGSGIIWSKEWSYRLIFGFVCLIFNSSDEETFTTSRRQDGICLNRVVRLATYAKGVHEMTRLRGLKPSSDIHNVLHLQTFFLPHHLNISFA
jgi:hypothetical protein